METFPRKYDDDIDYDYYSHDDDDDDEVLPSLLIIIMAVVVVMMMMMVMVTVVLFIAHKLRNLRSRETLCLELFGDWTQFLHGEIV